MIDLHILVYHIKQAIVWNSKIILASITTLVLGGWTQGTATLVMTRFQNNNYKA